MVHEPVRPNPDYTGDGIVNGIEIFNEGKQFSARMYAILATLLSDIPQSVWKRAGVIVI